ncbi:MAG TPA: hypothetical protein VGI54_04905, partial [Solirubrobacteraceae bacterium]
MSDAPDFAEPLIGFRAWRLEGGRLCAWSAATGPWSFDVTEAACCYKPHAAPYPGCSCGLYALADPRDRRLWQHGQVVGAIVAWGAVELHRSGFRAEKARVVALAHQSPFGEPP